MSEHQKIESVRLVDIVVPEIRVTSQFDPEIEIELTKSIQRIGIQQPLQCIRVAGVYHLVDGLHRAQIAAKLGVKEVPVVASEGSMMDVLALNIVANRMRGKSNPIEEGQVLRTLIEENNLTTAQACEKIGISDKWGRKLLRLTTLPKETQFYVQSGKLSVLAAVEIAGLPDVADQIALTNDAVTFGYTVEQAKARVHEIVDEMYKPEPGSYRFTPQGTPERVPFTCHICNSELGANPRYVWICDRCRGTVEEVLRQMSTAEQPPLAPEPTQTAPTTPPAPTEPHWRPD